MKTKYTIRSEVWLYPGMLGWHFVGVPKKESEQIKKTLDFLTKRSGTDQWGQVTKSSPLLLLCCLNFWYNSY